MVESLTRIPTPIVYQASADKIGLLGKDAMDVVIVYAFIELGRSGASSLINSREPDDISALTVEATGKTFSQSLHVRGISAASPQDGSSASRSARRQVD
jgi:hypothetical protein